MQSIGTFTHPPRSRGFARPSALVISTNTARLMLGAVGMLGVVFPRSALRHAPICSMSKPLSVGVIGGGVAGVTAARCLAEAGVEVVLHEREPQLGGRLGTVKVAGRSAWFGSNLACYAGKRPYDLTTPPLTHP